MTLQRTTGYTRFPNWLIDRLSGEALGVALYLMSLPPNWQVNADELQRRFGWGRDKTRKIMQEVESYGVLITKRRAENGRFTYLRMVADFDDMMNASKGPTDGKSANGSTVDGKSANGSTVDGKHVSIERNNKEKNRRTKTNEVPKRPTGRDNTVSQWGNGTMWEEGGELETIMPFINWVYRRFKLGPVDKRNHFDEIRAIAEKFKNRFSRTDEADIMVGPILASLKRVMNPVKGLTLADNVIDLVAEIDESDLNLEDACEVISGQFDTDNASSYWRVESGRTSRPYPSQITGNFLLASLFEPVDSGRADDNAIDYAF